MHSRSPGWKPWPRPTKNPLLRMLRWLSVAPFGNPVVPDVYWMLMASPGASPARRASRSPSVTCPAPATISSNSSSQKKIARSSAGTSGRT